MRGADITQAALFSYRSLEERIPSSHPLRKLRVVVDTILVSMDRELDAPEFIYGPLHVCKPLVDHGVRSTAYVYPACW